MAPYVDIRPGPKAQLMLRELAREWHQGEHVLITGPTGSGKTALARHLCNIRISAGGVAVAFIMKPASDETIVNAYERKGWVRWKKWKKNPSVWEDKILLWPDVSKAKGDRRTILDIQRSVFRPAINQLIDQGRHTVQIDEGLYFSSPTFLGFTDDLAMMHSIGRSGFLTLITLAQRPSHLPLIIYGSASNAFIGRNRETVDLKRLSELGAKEGSKALGAMVANESLHDFIWVPVATDGNAQKINLAQ